MGKCKDCECVCGQSFLKETISRNRRVGSLAWYEISYQSKVLDKRTDALKIQFCGPKSCSVRGMYNEAQDTYQIFLKKWLVIKRMDCAIHACVFMMAVNVHLTMSHINQFAMTLNGRLPIPNDLIIWISCRPTGADYVDKHNTWWRQDKSVCFTALLWL